MTDEQRYAGYGVVATGVLLFVGSFLPWITISAPFVGTISETGVSDGGGDGYITMIAGISACMLGAGFLVGKVKGRTLALVGLIAGVGCLAIGVYAYSDVSRRLYEAAGQSPLSTGGVGVGLVIVLVGSVGLMCAAAYLWKSLSIEAMEASALDGASSDAEGPAEPRPDLPL